MKQLAFIIGAVAAALAIASAAPGSTALAAEADAAAPVLDTDFPDPFVLPTSDGLVAYATNTYRRGHLVHVQMSRSADGRTWSPPHEAMPVTPAWARQDQPDIWAPEVIKAYGRYVMYFSARHATLTRPDGLTLCVGAAISDKPEGPFQPMTQPLTCGGRYGVIDASPFRDGDKLWLYLKSDSNCCGEPIRIFAQRLSDNGLDLVGQPTALDGVTNDRNWEGGVVEAPRMVAHGGAHWLFYSANDYSGWPYAVGVAECRRLKGPCEDSPRNPILSSTGVGPGALVGPGGESLFHWQGQTWMAFHGWRRRDGDRWRYRALYIAPVEWTSDGPEIGAPVAPAEDSAASTDAPDDAGQ
jgi:beta-xylosidase